MQVRARIPPGLGHTNGFLHMGELLGLFGCVKSLLSRELGPGAPQGTLEGTGSQSLELI